MSAIAWFSKSPSISVRTACAASPWTPPRVWCAARKSSTLAAPIMVPVGPGMLGRIINVIGEPVDEEGPVNGVEMRPIHAAAPAYVDQSTEAQILDHRHQGYRPAGALRQGRQDRPVRRRRRRQDGAHPGTDQQRRQGAWRLFGVRRRRRAHPRRQRPLSRVHRIRRQQEGRRRRLEGGAGVRPDERAAGRPRPCWPDRSDRRRIFPRPGPGRAVLRRQHLPLHAGGFGSVGAARPYSFGRGLSADARHRHGRAAGAHHHHAPRVRSPRCRPSTCPPTT